MIKACYGWNLCFTPHVEPRDAAQVLAAFRFSSW